jgi:hypothetical protein
LKLVDNPATNPTGASEPRFAVAIHEAGHAIAFAVVGIDVLSAWIGSGLTLAAAPKAEKSLRPTAPTFSPPFTPVISGQHG